MSFPRYPAYKDSGVEWLGEVPEHWDVLPLRRLIREVASGTSVNAVDEPAGPNQAGVLKTSCVYTGEFRPEENKAIIEDEIDRASCPVAAGCLVVSRMNTPDLVGAAGFVEDDSPFLFLPDRLWQVSFHDCDPKFMNYWCKSTSYRSQVHLGCSGTSSSMQNLSQDNFYSFMAPVPPPGEQHYITIFLDRETAKIDVLIAEQQRLIELLQEKRQAVISHAVTKGLNPNAPMKDSGVEWLGEVPEHWGTTRLKYLAESIVDCPHETPVYEEQGEFLVIRTADLDGGNLDESNMRRVEAPEYENRIRRASVDKDDIVYGREGERWGHAALVPCSGMFCLGQRMMQFRCGPDWVPRFVMWLLNSRPVYLQGSVDTVGSTSPHVNVSTIRNFALPAPPQEEQLLISIYLDQQAAHYDSLASRCRRSISLLRERRSALISAAATGQIDVRGLAQEASE